MSKKRPSSALFNEDPASNFTLSLAAVEESLTTDSRETPQSINHKVEALRDLTSGNVYASAMYGYSAL